jgi:hypothetical protein
VDSDFGRQRLLILQSSSPPVPCLPVPLSVASTHKPREEAWRKLSRLLQLLKSDGGVGVVFFLTSFFSEFDRAFEVGFGLSFVI